MAIQFELYKTPRPKDEEDKEVYHARVVTSNTLTQTIWQKKSR